MGSEISLLCKAKRERLVQVVFLLVSHLPCHQDIVQMCFVLHAVLQFVALYLYMCKDNKRESNLITGEGQSVSG